MRSVDKEFYLTQLAFWMSCLLFIFIEVQRKDFYQMLTHHFATIFLVAASYTLNYWRIGIAVLLCHDPADVFLYAAKTCKEYGWKTAADVLFVGFILSFFILRLVIFPIS